MFSLSIFTFLEMEQLGSFIEPNKESLILKLHDLFSHEMINHLIKTNLCVWLSFSTLFHMTILKLGFQNVSKTCHSMVFVVQQGILRTVATFRFTFFFSLNVEKTRHNQPEMHVELHSSEKLCQASVSVASISDISHSDIQSLENPT